MLSILLDQGTTPPEPAAAAAGGSGLLPWLPAGVAWLMTIAIIAYMLWQFRAEKSRQRTIDRFASPLVGALFALLALMAGTISQFYPGEITSAIPLAWAEKSPVSAALGFWISVVLMAALGIAYYAATGRQRVQEMAILQNESRDLRTHTEKLIATLRTLPPEGFMRDYPELCAAMLASFALALQEGDEKAKPDRYREAIRVALRTAALMAHKFSRRGDAAMYRANVMRMRDADSLGPVSSWSAEDRVLYPDGFEPAVIEGALVFEPTLATRASSEAAEALGGAPLRIAIPDPHRDSREGAAAEGKLRVVPGSAVAFLLGRPFIVDDTLDMRSHTAELCDLPEAVLNASDAYFRAGGPGHPVRSFVALPLFAEPGRMKGERRGVLNVEFEEPNIFNNDPVTVENFALAIAPVHFVIVLLLLLLDEKAGGDLLPAAS